MNQSRNRVAILMYHALEEWPSPISVTPARFERQMGLLHAGGYRVVALSEVVRRLRRGQPLPPRSVVLTFDDGFVSLATVGVPIIERYGFPATVFLVSGYCGRDNRWPSQPDGVPTLPLMGWGQIRELAAHGIEMGAHTVTHPRLDQIPLGRVHEEIERSKQEIEQRLGRAVKLFAYPYGRYNRLVKEAVGRIYEGACSTRLALADEWSDADAIERVDAQYVEHWLLCARLGDPVGRAYLGLRRGVRLGASQLLGRAWT